MPVVTGTARVATSVASAFEYVGNFANIGSWDPGVVTSQWAAGQDTSKVQVGSKFDLVTTFRGKESPMTYEVIEYAHPNRIVLRGVNDATIAVDTVRFEQAPDNAAHTIVHWHADISLRGFKSILNPFIGSMLAPLGPAAMQGLEKKSKELWGST